MCGTIEWRRRDSGKAGEIAKIELSTSTTSHITLPFFAAGPSGPYPLRLCPDARGTRAHCAPFCFNRRGARKHPCHSLTFLGLRAFACNTSDVSQFVEDIKNRGCTSSLGGCEGFSSGSKVAGSSRKVCIFCTLRPVAAPPPHRRSGLPQSHQPRA